MNILTDYQTTAYNKNDLNISSNQKTNEASFESVLKQDENIVQESKKGRFNKFLEKHNIFESLSLSKEDIALFKNILKDDNLSLKELKSLPYEKVQMLRKVMHPEHLSKEEFLRMPIVHTKCLNEQKNNLNQVNDMLWATSLTPNQNFNKALFDTYANIDLDRVRVDFSDSLSSFNILRTKVDPLTGAVSVIKIDYSLMNYDFYIQDNIKAMLDKSNNFVLSEQERIWAKLVYSEYLNFQKTYNELKLGERNT